MSAKLPQKPLGAIYLVPSTASSVLLQLAPEIRISCLMPARIQTAIATLEYSREIGSIYSGTEFNLDTPPLLISQRLDQGSRHQKETWSYCHCTECTARRNKEKIVHPPVCYCDLCKNSKTKKTSNTFYLWALSTIEGEKIRAKPYRIANVRESGNICWGPLEKSLNKLPKNLREANAIFWQSPFNKNLTTYQPAHRRCLKSSHRHYNHRRDDESKCKVQPSDGCRREVLHTCNCPDKTKHLLTCSCYKDNCECLCQCSCCGGSCKCICRCSCCTITCGCYCACDLTPDLIQMIQESNKSSYTNKLARGFEDITTLICGTRFISSSSGVTGVFISFNPILLKKGLQKTPRIVSPVGEMEGVGGLAYKSDDGWEVSFETESISLSDSQVCLV